MASFDGQVVAPFGVLDALINKVYVGDILPVDVAQYTKGYADGLAAGTAAGYADGHDDGYDEGFLAAQEVTYAYPGAVIVVTAQDYAGQPITGLTPTWACHFNVVSGAPVAGPAISAVGGGHYKFTPTGTPAGIIDLGSGATPRYHLYSPFNTHFVFVAYDDQGQPLAGLTPTFVNLKFVSDGTDASVPSITALGNGLYKTTMFEDHVVGLIDLGDTAFPRYVQYDSENYFAPGYALGYADGQNDPAMVLEVTQGVDTPLSVRMVNPSTGLLAALETTAGIVVSLKKFGGSFATIAPALAINGEYLDFTLLGATHLDTIGLADVALTIPGRQPVGIKLNVVLPFTGDATPPTITIISPPEGTAIGASQALVFRYNDENALHRPMPCIKIRQSDNTYKYELIHNGEMFMPDYSGTRVILQANPPIWEYTVRRRGGWTSTLEYQGVTPGEMITLVPFGTDEGGNEPA